MAATMIPTEATSRWADIDASESEEETCPSTPQHKAGSSSASTPSAASLALLDASSSTSASCSTGSPFDALEARSSSSTPSTASGSGMATRHVGFFASRAQEDGAASVASSASDCGISEDRPLNAAAPEFVPLSAFTAVVVGVAVPVGSDGQWLTLPVVDAARPSMRSWRGKAASASTSPCGRGSQGSSLSSRRSIASPLHVSTELSVVPEVVSEETWDHRVQQRIRCIDAVKETKEYASVRARAARRERQGDVGSLEEPEPLTPDPTDRTMSKRQWKGVIAEWRKALGKRHADDEHASCISTQDLQSVAESMVSLES